MVETVEQRSLVEEGILAVEEGKDLVGEGVIVEVVGQGMVPAEVGRIVAEVETLPVTELVQTLNLVQERDLDSVKAVDVLWVSTELVQILSVFEVVG